MALQQEHADVFAEFKDAVAEDDIERLKRKFAEERALMIEDHEDRLAEIKKQVEEEERLRAGVSTGAGAGAGVPAYTVDQLAQALVSKGGYNPTDAYNAASNAGEGLMNSLRSF